MNSEIRQRVIDGLRGQGILVTDPNDWVSVAPGENQWWRLDEKNLEWIADRLLRTPGVAVAAT